MGFGVWLIAVGLFCWLVAVCLLVDYVLSDVWVFDCVLCVCLLLFVCCDCGLCSCWFDCLVCYWLWVWLRVFVLLCDICFVVCVLLAFVYFNSVGHCVRYS